VDALRARVELKLDVVDEPEHPARELGVQVAGPLGGERRTFGAADRIDQRGPDVGGIGPERDRRDVVAGIGRIDLARHAVRRRRARREPAVADAEVRRPRPGEHAAPPGDEHCGHDQRHRHRQETHDSRPHEPALRLPGAFGSVGE
jgi:hypothetical protein